MALERGLPATLPDHWDLDNRIERLALLDRAMWSLIAEKLDLSNDDLVDAAKSLDAQSGQPDGRYRATRGDCPSCGSVSAVGAPCHFCGEAVGSIDPFARI